MIPLPQVTDVRAKRSRIARPTSCRPSGANVDARGESLSLSPHRRVAIFRGITLSVADERKTRVCVARPRSKRGKSEARCKQRRTRDRFSVSHARSSRCARSRALGPRPDCYYSPAGALTSYVFLVTKFAAIGVGSRAGT